MRAWRAGADTICLCIFRLKRDFSLRQRAIFAAMAYADIQICL
jgi:hypothetical protein